MYYPQAPKEPSGCFQTIIITRMIVVILLVPVLLILAVLLLVLLTFYALTINPLLAILTIAGGAGLVIGLARWEAKRVAKEIPPDDT